MRQALVAALLALLPAPAMAQAWQCTLPERIGPVAPARPDGPPRRVAIGGYTLAASWSPEYCKGSGDRDAMQCSGRSGRFGFILHGLWPEARKGPPPQWCATAPQPSPELIRRNLCMTPAPGLIAHEWAKHGSCMAKKPETYLRVAGVLWRSIRWPDADELSRKPGLTAGDLRREFALANAGWKPDQVGLLVSRSGWLREVRLCYGRDFLPTACNRFQAGPPDSAPLKIWRGL